MTLAALIAAYHESNEPGGSLRATLPLAGRTLVERQARLASAAGAAPIILAVERVPPELTAAIDRLRAEGLGRPRHDRRRPAPGYGADPARLGSPVDPASPRRPGGGAAARRHRRHRRRAAGRGGRTGRPRRARDADRRRLGRAPPRLG